MSYIAVDSTDAEVSSGKSILGTANDDDEQKVFARNDYSSGGATTNTSTSMISHPCDSDTAAESAHNKGRRGRGRRRTRNPNAPIKVRSCPDVVRWYFQAPFQRLPFIYFLAYSLGAIALAVYWFMDASTAFIICGVTAATLALYGYYRFRQLLSLKAEVDDFSVLNRSLKRENTLLEIEVERLQCAVFNLQDVRQRIGRSIAINRANQDKFRMVRDTLGVLNQQQQLSMHEVLRRVAKIDAVWKSEIIKHEKQVLHSVFERYERRKSSAGSHKSGLDRDAYDEFRMQLPYAYRKKFERLASFDTLKNQHGYIDNNTFVDVLDMYIDREMAKSAAQFVADNQQRTPLPPSAAAGLNGGSAHTTTAHRPFPSLLLAVDK